MTAREDELQAILDAIAGFPTGVSVGSLLGALESPSMARRTLQRRLLDLVQEGRLVARGEGPSRRYVIAAEPGEASDPKIESALLPLGGEALSIRRLVKAPLVHREPVGYRTALELQSPGGQQLFVARNPTPLEPWGSGGG